MKWGRASSTWAGSWPLICSAERSHNSGAAVLPGRPRPPSLVGEWVGRESVKSRGTVLCLVIWATASRPNREWGFTPGTRLAGTRPWRAPVWGMYNLYVLGQQWPPSLPTFTVGPGPLPSVSEVRVCFNRLLTYQRVGRQKKALGTVSVKFLN